MNLMTKPDVRVPGQEHWTNRGDVRLFLWEKRATRAREGRHHPVRARLVHGVAADLRPAGAGAHPTPR